VKAVLLLALFPLAAHAQVYKCTQDGKVTYSEAPCAGNGTVLDTPAATQRDERELARLKREAASLEKQRRVKEAREDRADAQAAQAAARHREKCDKLMLERRWAEQDARNAQPQAAEAAQRKARRAAERHAAGCQ
jgi:hypothetical protein